MTDTKLIYELDGSGRITVRATNEGVLLSKEEAECVAARIRELESLVRDMWRTLSAMYQLNLGIDIGKEHDYEQRIAALRIEVDG